MVFLPGEREIREAADVLGRNSKPGLEILPLFFSRLSIEEQDRIFRPSGARRIVLATNIAETSITVPGIPLCEVDSGLGRVKRYSYRNKVEQLQSRTNQPSSCSAESGPLRPRLQRYLYSSPYDGNRILTSAPKYTDPGNLKKLLSYGHSANEVSASF